MGEKKINISKDWYKGGTKKSLSKSMRSHQQFVASAAGDLPSLMTIEEAAQALRRHIKTIRDWTSDGSLKSVKIKGRRFTTAEWIADFINTELYKNA